MKGGEKEMDIPTVTNSSTKASVNGSTSSSATAIAGQATTSTSKSGNGTFANLLQTEASSADTQEQASSVNSELLVAMSLMPQSIQQLLGNLEADAPSDQSLVASILEAMNNDSDLANMLLNDSDVQNWLQDANSLLNAWAAQTAGLGNSIMNLQTISNQGATEMSGSQADVLSMQRTLMTLSTLNQQQPNHPILQHLLAQLQQVMEPYNASIANQANSALQGAELLAQNLAVATDKNAMQEKQLPRIKGAIVNGQASTTGNALNADQPVEKIAVQSSLSKLEILAAKSIHSFASLTSDIENTEVQAEVSTASDLSSNLELGSALQTGLKNPLQMADATKAIQPTVNAANFAEDMSQFVVKTMKVSLLGDGLSEAKLTLQPQNLGHIDVKLTMHNGNLIAQIATHTLGAKEMLESQLPQLRMMLQNQGFQVERLEVTQNSSASSMMFQDQGQRQQSFNQDQFTSSQSNSDSYGIEEMELMQEIVDAKESMRNAGIESSSFHASA